MDNQLRVRRFFCVNAGCAARTFAEQIVGRTARRARRSPLLRRMLESNRVGAGRASGVPGSPTYWACRPAAALFHEISERGYRGACGTVAAYVAPFRALDAAPPPTQAVPEVRPIASHEGQTGRGELAVRRPAGSVGALRD
jgi:hypothetical protein